MRDETLDPALRSRIENAILEYHDAQDQPFRGLIYSLARMPVEAIELWLSSLSARSAARSTSAPFT